MANSDRRTVSVQTHLGMVASSSESDDTSAFIEREFAQKRRKIWVAGNREGYSWEAREASSEREKYTSGKNLGQDSESSKMPDVQDCMCQNLSAGKAIEFRSDKDPGESIIRLSSKGPSFRTLSLKISDGVYAHTQILLRDKENMKCLNEIIDECANPLKENIKKLLAYRKFKKGTRSYIDEQLRAEKAEKPKQIVYAISLSHQYPGTFVLSYMHCSNPHHEYIGLFPGGFRFHKRDFVDIDRLVAHFQKNIYNPPPNDVTLGTVLMELVDGNGGGKGGKGGRCGLRDSNRSDGFGGRGQGRGRGHGNYESGSSMWGFGSRKNNSEVGDNGRRDSGGSSWSGGGNLWGDGASGGRGGRRLP